MMEIMRSRNLSTKFQILAEVAANQPDVQQRSIAGKLGISRQAVSDYMRELVSDGWMVSEGRSRYSVTREGVDWMLRGLREWQGYSDSVLKAIASLSVCAAIADCDLSSGQRVSLVMRDGLLYATSAGKGGASGTATTAAGKGEDVGVKDIDGIVPLEVGRVTVLRVPGIQKGGSRQAGSHRIIELAAGRQLVGAIGVEAIIALRRAGIEPACLYGVKEAVAEAARSGLSPLVVCIEDDTTELLRQLEDKGIQYELIDEGRQARPRRGKGRTR